MKRKLKVKPQNRANNSPDIQIIFHPKDTQPYLSQYMDKTDIPATNQISPIQKDLNNVLYLTRSLLKKIEIGNRKTTQKHRGGTISP